MFLSVLGLHRNSEVSPCSGGQAGSCWLCRGDLLVMDGECQDDFVHCTSPGLVGGERMNATFSWVKRHGGGCPLAPVVVSRLPTCAQGSSVLEHAGEEGEASVGGLILLAGLVVAPTGGFLFWFAKPGLSRSRCGQRVELWRRTRSLRGVRCFL